MEIKSYLSVFQTTEEYENFKLSTDFVIPNITLCEDNKVIYYETDDYFTVLNTSQVEAILKLKKNGIPQNLYYKLSNKDEWEESTSCIIQSGELAKFSCNLTPNDEYGIGTFSVNDNARIEIKGNIMSLIYGNDFKNKTDLNDRDYVFKKLFLNCKPLLNLIELQLPATVLSNGCYESMFAGCTRIKNTPKLNAESLSNNCYSGMFSGCTSLTEAPKLPATTLADSCYYGMFRNCTSLKISPELPATTLTNRCYYNMFFGCTSLNNITILATDISASGCLTGWVNGVSSSGTFIKSHTMSSFSTDTSGIPSKWSVNNYVYKNKLPYIVTTSSIDISFNTNTELWTPSKNIIDLDAQTSFDYKTLSPTKILNVDVYSNGNYKKSLTWNQDDSVVKFLTVNSINVDNHFAIFINEMNNPSGDSSDSDYSS